MGVKVHYFNVFQLFGLEFVIDIVCHLGGHGSRWVA